MTMKDNGNNHVNNDVNNSVNDNANNYGNNDDMKNNIHAGKNTADGSFTEKDAGTGKGKMSGRRRASGPLMIVLVLAALIVLYNTLYTVAEDEYAVVTRFGRITTVKSEAGLYARTPFVESVRKVSKVTQLYDISPSDVITQDKKSMIADDFILWKVNDAGKFTRSLNASVPAAEDLTSVAVYNATKNIISSMSQDDVIAARGEKLTNMITKEANSDLGNYGIVIEKAAIKALDLPDDNKDAVYERMVSERNNIAASYTAKGKADAQKIRNQTDRDVEVMKADAGKQADITVAAGEAEYMKILQGAYDTEDKKDFYVYMRGLDALKESMTGSNKTIILDKDSELAKLLSGKDAEGE